MRGSTQSDRSGLFHGVVNTHPEARLRFGVGLCVLFLIADGSDRVVLQQPVFGHCGQWGARPPTAAMDRSTVVGSKVGRMAAFNTRQ